MILPSCGLSSSAGKESFAVMERDESSRDRCLPQETILGAQRGKWCSVDSEVLGEIYGITIIKAGQVCNIFEQE